MAPQTRVPDDIERRLSTLGDRLAEQLGEYREIELESYRHDWKTQRTSNGRASDHRSLHGPRVHDYARLDPAIVLRVLRTDIADVERFRDAVLRVI